MAKYKNYCSNLEVLHQASQQNLENEFVQTGIIGKFSLQFELAWKLLQKLLRQEGVLQAQSGSPRTVLKEAYTLYSFLNEGIWLDMLEARNTSSHLYDAQLAQSLIKDILQTYIPAFDALKAGLIEMYGEEFLEET